MSLFLKHKGDKKVKKKISLSLLRARKSDSNHYCDSWKSDNYRESNQKKCKEFIQKIKQRRCRAIDKINSYFGCINIIFFVHSTIFPNKVNEEKTVYILSFYCKDEKKLYYKKGVILFHLFLFFLHKDISYYIHFDKQKYVQASFCFSLVSIYKVSFYPYNKDEKAIDT